jgi:hypothetical protein
MVLLNEWMKEIHGGGAQGKGRRCTYKLSDEIRATLPKDSAVRHLHIDAGHKLRTYALFKEKLGLHFRVISDSGKGCTSASVGFYVAYGCITIEDRDR